MTIQLSRRTVAIALAAFLAFAGLATASFVLTLTRTAEANDKFNDIATGTFFHEPTAWLADNGIADGFPGGSFKPNDNITRGQAAYWFANYNNAITEHVSNFTTFGNGAEQEAVLCPAGKRPIGGGGEVNDPAMLLATSRPIEPALANFLGNEGWYVEWIADNGVDNGPGLAGEVFVICAPDPIPD